jgi:hypothetical protein
MPEDKTEQLLKSLAVRTLGPDADSRIVAAVQAADPPRHRHWWARGIPLWQAAAACLAVFAVTFLSVRASLSPTGAPTQVQPTPVESPQTEKTDRPPYYTDISGWKVSVVPNQGG